MGASGLHDAHCHLDFMENAEEVCRMADEDGCLLFANTVTPGGYLETIARLDGLPGVSVGVGCHPWWVPEVGDDDVRLACELIATALFVGEVGLDFGRKGTDPDRQLEIFGRLARAAAESGGRILSIHAVASARQALDVLESVGALEACTCIFHWFSGPVEQLHRAIGAGCLFSINEMMARSRRGREYLKVIPAGSMLLETDAPPGEGVVYRYQELRASLSRTLGIIAEVKGADACGAVLENGSRLLGTITRR